MQSSFEKHQTGNSMSLNECQCVELDIMKSIHKFCNENGICYVLAYGSLLGAVRHQGFIPWDNDMDIMMPRSDYEKFLCLAEEGIDSHHYILNYRNDAKFHYQCTRVCDDRTFVSPNYIREQPSRMGVWVDIFPVDGVCKKQYEHMIKLIKMKFYKQLTHWEIYSHSEADSLKENIKHIIGKIFQDRNNRFEYEIDEIASKQVFSLSRNVGVTTEYEKTFLGMTPNDFSQRKLALFESEEFYIPKNWDRCLRGEYGNYMVVPSEEDRQTHSINAVWVS